MKMQIKKLLSICSMLVLFGFGLAQSEDSSDPFGGDPFSGYTDSLESSGELESSNDRNNTPKSEPSYKSRTSNKKSYSEVDEFYGEGDNVPTKKHYNTNQNDHFPSAVTSTSDADDPDKVSLVQNAIIEGIQISTDKGELPDEKIISAYFIFRDKPSSYFYEIKLREKKLIFEFNDTKTGASPVPSVFEPPIRSFVIENGKVDINKDVKGLKPEWHDMIRVVFDLEAVPEIHVNDEYSVISFSFKWSNNPDNLQKYVVKDKTPKVVAWSSIGVGAIGLGALAFFLLKPDDPVPELKPLPYDDLPTHQ
jgi:hypothetical protein